MTALVEVRHSPRVTDGSCQAQDLALAAEVCVVGSGAGGAVTAATLAAAGHDVLLIEEGGYLTSDDFTAREQDTVTRLYQEGATRATADGAIAILQGRAVGGTTVVNWTTSFRTPEDVVATWRERHHVGGFAYADLVPHYEWIERRLCIERVSYDSMNENNKALHDGCTRLGWQVETLRRNVFRCGQTGMCHLGCPLNAKRSMLVTLIPDAIDAGARLVFRARGDRFESAGGEVTRLHGSLLGEDGYKPSGRRFTVTARRFVLAGGAINSPALLLRSGLDGPAVGRRTFLHPVVPVVGVFDREIDPTRGAPQSAASHHFAHRGDEVGFFLEAAPWYPSLASTVVPGYGAAHEETFVQVKRMALHLALFSDGFHADVPGGRVTLRPSGAPLVDYPIPERLWRGFRFATKRLVEAQLAAGARRVMTVHEPPVVMDGRLDEAAIDAAPWRPGSAPVYTAHQMGGCAMGDDPASSVVRSEDLRHHQLRNLFVMDGSVFPTSLGVNPQESIYGLTRLMASRLAAHKG